MHLRHYKHGYLWNIETNGSSLCFHITIDGILSFMQNAVGFIGATAMMITFLFAIAVLYVASIKKLSNNTESWFA